MKYQITESNLRSIIQEAVMGALSEGWVSGEVVPSEEIFNDIISKFRDKDDVLYATEKSMSGSVYEFLTDYIRDYYDVSLRQCDKIARMLKDHYEFEKFYAND